jgi:ABC-type multidrug transport system fused ATPase/permease subunit
MIGIMLLFTGSQLSRVFCDLWIGLYAATLEQGTPAHTTDFYMIWYYVLIWGTVLLVMLRSYWFVISCLGASRKLHSILLTSVLSAPVNTYFDVTPMGRILNRFSKDLDSMDSLLPDFLLQAIQNIFQIISIICVCLSSSAYFVVLFIPISFMFYYIQSYFRKSSRELKRLESIARSPMYSLFGEILQGHSTIRAYGRIENFTRKFFEVTDLQVGNFFVFWMANRWLALRLDVVSNLIVFAVAILAVVITDNGGGIDANLLGKH